MYFISCLENLCIIYTSFTSAFYSPKNNTANYVPTVVNIVEPSESYKFTSVSAMDFAFHKLFGNERTRLCQIGQEVLELNIPHDYPILQLYPKH